MTTSTRDRKTFPARNPLIEPFNPEENPHLEDSCRGRRMPATADADGSKTGASAQRSAASGALRECHVHTVIGLGASAVEDRSGRVLVRWRRGAVSVFVWVLVSVIPIPQAPVDII
jgi:hypothetical protein